MSVISETTNTSDNNSTASYIFYDGNCSMCSNFVRRLEGSLGRRGFRFIPLQDSWAHERLGLDRSAPLTEMLLQTPEGNIIGGADAAVYLARATWWGWPVYGLSLIPGMMPVFRSVYRWIAARRHCLAGACARTAGPKWPGWLPLVLFPSLVFAFGRKLLPWAFMWTLAYSIFAGFKWLTWWLARVRGVRAKAWRSLGYLLLWPGMDPSAFLNGSEHRKSGAETGQGLTGAVDQRIPDVSWVPAIEKSLLGAVLLWALPRNISSPDPLGIGWLGLIALILLVPFGLFELLAVFWKALGVQVKPLMHAPALANSLSDFWNNRWNTAFRKLAHDFVFLPLRKRIGVRWAMLATFVASGLIHDLLISLPAGSGFGLPTAYFACQGAGILVERSALGRRSRLRGGLKGRLYAIAVVVGPVFWLFHPPFILRVIVPFMAATRAI
jgi:predicted DCC family thiol-disulfide oxidoreductase YuxK